MTRQGLDRRTFIRGAGVTAGVALAPGAAATIDDALDLDGGLQEVIVVLEDDADPAVLDRFDLTHGYHAFEVLPFAYTRATGEQIQRIGALDAVQYVEKNKELELHNDDGRRLTGAEAVHDDLGVTGDGVHAVVIDTGLTTHPDLVDSLAHNYHFVDPLTTDEDQMWVDVNNADIDDVGHGSHVAGSIAGDGTMSEGQYRGTAPDATITGYKTNIAGALYIIYLVAAIEDVLQKQQAGEIDVQIVNNSFGSSNDGDFNPGQAIHRAYWEAFNEGIVPVFSAGNSGPDHGTLNYLGKQPYSLCVAATHTGVEGEEKKQTSFSSRGRPPASDEEEPYADDYDFSRYERTEGPNYDRREALRNVRDFHQSGQADADEVESDYTDEFTVTVDTTINDPTAWTAAVGLSTTIVDGGSVAVGWDSPADAGYLDATFDVGELDRQAVGVDLYRGDEDAVENDEAVLVAGDGGVVRDGPLEFSVPLDEEQTYTFVFQGFNNVETEVTAHLTVLEEVPRPDGPFGMYRCDVGAPGNLITSTNKTTEVLGALSETDADPFYADVSGTSMSCPLTVGIVALVLEAYKDEAGHFPKPIDAINIVEATAEGGTDEELLEHTEANMGAGFVDAEAAVELARELGARPQSRGGPKADDPTVADYPQLWNQIELCGFETPPCYDVVAAHEFLFLNGYPVLRPGFQIGGTVLQNSSPTDPFTLEEGAFDDTEHPERRILATMTWNPDDEGPNNANLFLDRRNDAGEWETIGYERTDSLLDGTVQGANELVLEAVDGDRYEGTDGDGTTPDVDNEVVVAGGNEYRFRVQGEDGVQLFEIDVEVQSYDPECIQDDESTA